MPQELFGLNASDLSILKRMARWFQTAHGRGIRNTPWGLSFDLPQANPEEAIEDGPLRLRYKSSQPNYLVCRAYDGSTEGAADVYVAKKPKLRHDKTLYRTPAGVSLTALTAVSADRVTVTGPTPTGTVSETWTVWPPYVADEEIEAEFSTLAAAVNGGDGRPCSLMEKTDGGREWGVTT